MNLSFVREWIFQDITSEFLIPSLTFPLCGKNCMSHIDFHDVNTPRKFTVNSAKQHMEAITQSTFYIQFKTTTTINKKKILLPFHWGLSMKPVYQSHHHHCWKRWKETYYIPQKNDKLPQTRGACKECIVIQVLQLKSNKNEMAKLIVFTIASKRIATRCWATSILWKLVGKSQSVSFQDNAMPPVSWPSPCIVYFVGC